MSEQLDDDQAHGQDDGHNLGEMAQASLDIPGMPSTDGAQQTIEGTDYTVLKFMGLKYTMLEYVPPIGEVLRFELRVQVVGNGDELMANEQIRHTVKVKPIEIVQLVDAPDPGGQPTY